MRKLLTARAPTPSQSPYFFNAGLLASGPVLNTLCGAYAATLAAALKAEHALPPFDVLFGPAYKGIPFAAGTALLLHREHGIDVGFAYDRKEAKDHGEGGVLVGAGAALIVWAGFSERLYRENRLPHPPIWQKVERTHGG